MTRTPKNDGITSRASNQWLAPSSAAAESIDWARLASRKVTARPTSPVTRPKAASDVEQLEEEIHGRAG